jgi:transmembrane sensor
MDRQEARLLLERYLAGECTQEEEERIKLWYRQLEEEYEWELTEGTREIRGQQLKAKINTTLGWQVPSSTPLVIRSRTRQWWMAAAVILLLVVGGSAWWLLQDNKITIPQVTNLPLTDDVAPGGNKAILTLADGTRITLDSAENGALAQQGGAQVNKVDGGQLTYETTSPPPRGTMVQYNTLVTPRGGSYSVTLPDGTKVWLNAASRLQYPTAFTGPERKVTLEGEAYFEVVSNAAQPFKVMVAAAQPDVDAMEVTVLGTRFNIMAYRDEKTINTTLIAGIVKVAQGNTVRQLAPDQQAKVSHTGEMVVQQEPDAAGTIAWKNGLFHFQKADLASIMRQIARWYDVEIIYEGHPEVRMSGMISRNINVSEVLKLLESNGARFRIDGKKIVVL